MVGTQARLQDRYPAHRLPGQQVMVQYWEVTEVEIDGRTFWVAPYRFLGSGQWKRGGRCVGRIAG